MRRLVPIAAFVLFLALPLWAQHGGGHAGGGHGGGFSGHAGFGGGHAGGGHVSGGMHSGMGSSRGFSSRGFSSRGSSRGFNRGPSFSQRSSNRGPFLHKGFRGNRFGRGSGNRFRTFGFRNNCFGLACRGFGYPWAYGASYDPFWWGDSGSSYDEDYERDRAVANDMNQQSLEQQQMLRQEEADGDQDSYSSRSSRQRSDPGGSSSGSMQQGAPIIPATVLVFRDQRREEIQNYAIVGQTLWNFAPKHTEKIPLSDLDVPATSKANEDRGVTFRIPESGEAQ